MSLRHYLTSINPSDYKLVPHSSAVTHATHAPEVTRVAHFAHVIHNTQTSYTKTSHNYQSAKQPHTEENNSEEDSFSFSILSEKERLSDAICESVGNKYMTHSPKIFLDKVKGVMASKETFSVVVMKEMMNEALEVL